MHDNSVEELKAALMRATDEEVIEICEERNISHMDEDGFNRSFAVLNIFMSALDKALTDD